MTPVTTMRGRSVALFGLGGSGFATAEALKAGGAQVAVWDDNAGARERAAAAGHTVVDLAEADWSGFSALILSPGVPLTHPAPHWTVTKAHAAGLEVIGDVELFCRERARVAPDAPFFAITGTNGKSTTTALLAHLLRALGRTVEMGGNIGVPILSLEPPSPDRCHVIELSTFQIDLTPSLRPSVGILLNLTPDHIDRHGTMERYAGIKERLVARADRAVIAVDDPWCAAIAERLATAGKPVTRVSTHASFRAERSGDPEPGSLGNAGPGSPVPGSPSAPRNEDSAAPLTDGLTLDGTRIMLHVGGRAPYPMADLAGIASLRGRHNGQNAAVAIAALSQALDADGQLQPALVGFPGLAHRMEQVGRRGRVLFVNDSKATNADAAEQSLKAFQTIHWIVGGVSKEGGLAPLAPVFPHVAKAYLIGKSTDDFAASLDGNVPYARCGTLEAALQLAASEAAESGADEPVVLLAPACASYDQFKNFEERGDRFRELVAGLPVEEKPA
ncbi:UDP-N-acetylmuramoyl-L-alanine--D-glutamate ligase [Lichenihabitans sp. Uapishka_5]|uniref:Mur ligase family protein n=1 Tax=Lichenihabitans sp. Uapishka_5 TaxID=3037302 RepID=UPI0029E824C5|nr:UDP-N-acetylmuramoyl-L-alanine--D-glutamate ligase [Lichenihabitans sp. Uapishka_5]MDX7952261.1 UDP-N-acetylmuramoyl-L-alanine--D-glutamate ligase [Lichenihabitans sp. Uapishka_5]